MAGNLRAMAKCLTMRADRSPLTIPIVAVRGMLGGSRQPLSGPQRDALLRHAGVDPSLLGQDAARVTGEQYVALMEALLRALDDEALGFLSRPLRPGCLALVARQALGAADGLGALHRVARGIDLLQDDVRLQAVADGPRCALTVQARHGQIQPNFLHEYLLRVSWRLLVWMLGGRLRPRGFDFAHPRPDYAALVGTIFPGELRFGQARSAVWFDRSALAAPLRRDEAALRRFVQSSLTHLMLPHAQASGQAARVRHALMRRRPHWPALDEVAASLSMAPSTLQRHLAAEQTSFQAIKDALRRDLAIARLQQGEVPLAVLAAELGFTEPATFQRAFKAWTGTGPGRYRPRRDGAD